MDTWGNLIAGVEMDKRDTVHFTHTGIRSESSYIGT